MTEDDFVYLLWVRDNTPYEMGHTLFQIFYNKDKADEKCRELNDKANRAYQEELKELRGAKPIRGNYPRFSYHVNQWRIH